LGNPHIFLFAEIQYFDHNCWNAWEGTTGFQTLLQSFRNIHLSSHAIIVIQLILESLYSSFDPLYLKLKQKTSLSPAKSIPLSLLSSYESRRMLDLDEKSDCIFGVSRAGPGIENRRQRKRSRRRHLRLAVEIGI
jgi:hypothetical protein